MEEPKSNTNNEEKYIIGRFPYICLILGVLFFISVIIQIVDLYIFISTGGFKGGIWLYLQFISGFLFFISLIIMAIGIIAAYFKLLFYQTTLRYLLIILLGFLFLIAGFVTTSVFYRNMSQDHEELSLRFYVRSKSAISALKFIQKTLPEYAKKHEGRIPSTEYWCKELIDIDPNAAHTEATFTLNYGNKSERFAMNKYVMNMLLDKVPNDIVLVFETKYDSETIGSRESITSEYYHGRGALILFGDLRIEFVKIKDFNSLQWEP